MLPPDVSDRYQKFQHALDQLEQTVAHENADSVKLRDTFALVQQIFTSQIANLSDDDLKAATSSRLQSYLTEIDKHLRLLSVDITFLVSARRSETVQARLAQISDRLHSLKSYSQALLQIE
jgi:hypothetical protein